MSGAHRANWAELGSQAQPEPKADPGPCLQGPFGSSGSVDTGNKAVLSCPAFRLSWPTSGACFPEDNGALPPEKKREGLLIPLWRRQWEQSSAGALCIHSDSALSTSVSMGRNSMGCRTVRGARQSTELGAQIPALSLTAVGCWASLFPSLGLMLPFTKW